MNWSQRENGTVGDANTDKSHHRHHPHSCGLASVNLSQWVGKFCMQDPKESS